MKTDIGFINLTDGSTEALKSAAALTRKLKFDSEPAKHQSLTIDLYDAEPLALLHAIKDKRDKGGQSDDTYIGQIFYGVRRAATLVDIWSKWLGAVSPFTKSKPMNILVDVDPNSNKSLTEQFQEQVEAGRKTDFALVAKERNPAVDEVCDLITAMTQLANKKESSS